MNQEEQLKQETFNAISNEQDEFIESRKIFYDKRTKQFSIKIPKSYAAKANLKENSEIMLVFNPKDETKQKINKSRFILYLKEENEEKKPA